ncbi:AAA family ATPase [bacterium]|nr:AAA family ATPase [bacterium]
MGKIISIVNQKGGVGKTTTAVNLGSYLAHFGKQVLLVDVDPQANATSGLGIDVNSLEEGIYEAIVGSKKIFNIIKKTKQKNYELAPANPSLAGAGVELVSLPEREWRLLNILKEVRDNYDYIIIDGPPSLGLLTVNNLVAADEIIIPIQSEYYSLEGLGQLLETIDLVKDNLKPDLKIKGAIVTMYDKRNRLSGLVMKELENHFPHYIFKAVIPRNVRLAESPSFGKSILNYDKRSKGAQAYYDLAKEVIKLDE